MPDSVIGVFGGSGFTAFLDAVEERTVETPYGSPSAPVVLGRLGGRTVAFLPRHGRNHELPPHRIPYRANLWAIQARDGGTVVVVQGPRFSTRAESRRYRELGGVTAGDVLRVFGENNDRLRELLPAAIPRIGPQPDDACARAPDGAVV